MIKNNKIAALLLIALTANSNILCVQRAPGSSSFPSTNDALYEQLLPIARTAQNRATDLRTITSPDGKYRARISESEPDAITVTILSGEPKSELGKLVFSSCDEKGGIVCGGKKSASFPLPYGSGNPLALAYSPDGKYLACANGTGHVTVFIIEEDGVLGSGTSFALPSEFDLMPGFLAYSPDGKYLFVAHSKDSDEVIMFSVYKSILLQLGSALPTYLDDKHEATIYSKLYHRSPAWDIAAVVVASLVVAGPVMLYCRSKTRVKQD